MNNIKRKRLSNLRGCRIKAVKRDGLYIQFIGETNKILMQCREDSLFDDDGNYFANESLQNE